MLRPSILPPSRFSAVSPWMAGAILLGLALLVAVGLAGGNSFEPAPAGGGDRVHHQGDQALYQRVIADVAQGESYYASAAKEHRRGHFPLKPSFAVRPPVLAVALAALPDDAVRTASLRLLVGFTVLVWAWRLHALYGTPTFVGLGALAMGLGLVPALGGGAYVFHECWAGGLIALSLALRTPQRWGASVVAGFAAAAVRELALPYLVIMGAMAWREGRRREAVAWLVAVLAVAGGMVLHAFFLAAVVRPEDLASQGWLALGGWTFVLSSERWTALLAVAPWWLVAVVVPAALLGLLGWRGQLGTRLALLGWGYSAAFLVVGRPDNFYWGLMLSGILTLGLVSLPGSLWDLGAQLTGCGKSAAEKKDLCT